MEHDEEQLYAVVLFPSWSCFLGKNALSCADILQSFETTSEALKTEESDSDNELVDAFH